MSERLTPAGRGLLASSVLAVVAVMCAVVGARRVRESATENHELRQRLSTLTSSNDRDAAPEDSPTRTDTPPDAMPDPPRDETFSFLWGVGRVLIPAGFLVTLAYYFGWTRTRKLYRELGVDHSLLGFSTDDYALRSLGVLVTPLPVVAGYVLVLALIYAASARWLARGGASQLKRKSGSVIAIVLLVSVWTFLDGWNDGDWMDTIAFLVISAAVVVLSALLVTAREDAFSRDEIDAQQHPASVTSVKLVALALLVLYAFSAFEIVRQHALDEGLDAATEAEAHPDRYACVVLLSARPLGLIESVGEPIIGEDSAYYRYGGLRVFTRSAGRLFVWPSDRSPRAGLFIINETDIVSAQLVPQRNFGACPQPEQP